MDAIKVFFCFVTGAFITIMNPLLNPVIVLVILFLLDIVGGLAADRMLNRMGFRFAKFLKSVAFLFLYVVIIASIYLICYLQNDISEGLLLLKTITYVCGYFYFSNIARNLHESYPKNRFFSFLFFVLSVDILTSRIPVLRKFLETESASPTASPTTSPTTSPPAPLQKRGEEGTSPTDTLRKRGEEGTSPPDCLQKRGEEYGGEDGEGVEG
jgi:hypothetical protein